MFLKHSKNGKMVEVLGLNDLFNPNHVKLVGRYNAGEELQDAEDFPKSALEFLSGESLYPMKNTYIEHLSNKEGNCESMNSLPNSMGWPNRSNWVQASAAIRQKSCIVSHRS